MNERIKVLAEQAGGEFFPGWWEGMSTSVKFYKEEDLQKFTALIVNECIAQIRKDENGVAYEAVARIIDHFGV